MKPIRIGIIGAGNMGSSHAANMSKVAGVRLVAVCDADRLKADRVAEQYSCTAYYGVEDLLNSGTIDAVLIATPHYSHTPIGIAALRKGLHVLMEKPISVHTADCRRLLAEHTSRRQVFAAMFNQRTDPHYRAVRDLVAAGRLGELTRVNWIITDWFRTQAYYDSSDWRATWKGEGGGVLLNQCPHNLDLLQWICGMPVRVRGHCSLGKRHAIEVEDEVTAYLEYPNGATGVFVTSTGEQPGTNRLEICGDRGKVVVELGRVHFTKNRVSASKVCRTSKVLFPASDVQETEIPVTGNGGQHVEILQNFIDAIRKGTPLIAPAKEGIHSVELANAILFSSLIDKTVEIPLNAAAYERSLKGLIAGSGLRKNTPRLRAKVDMKSSF